MPVFTVQAEVRGRPYTIEVEAPDEATAQAAAQEELSKPEYMTKEERDAAVEEGKANMQAAQQQFRRTTQLGSIMGESATEGLAAAAESVLGAANAATELAAEYGVPGAEKASDWLNKRRDVVEEAGLGITMDGYKKAFGRNLTEEEKKEIRSDYFKIKGRGEFIADVGLAAGPGKLIGGARTLWGAIAAGAVDGGVSTFLLADSDAATIQERNAERIGNATVGAAFGGLLNGGLVGIPAGLKNWTGRKVNKAIEDAGGIEKYREAQELAGDRMSLGQFTGSPAILRAEREAAGDIAQQASAEAVENTIRNIGRTHGVDLPSTGRLGDGLRDHVDAFTKGIADGIGEARKIAYKAFRNTLAEAEAKWAGPIFKPNTDKFVPELTRIATEVRAGTGNAKINPEVQKLMTDLLEGSQNGLGARKVNEVLARLNQIIGDHGDGFFLTGKLGEAATTSANRLGRAYASQMKGLLSEAIDQARPLNAQAAEALTLLKKARQRYGRRMSGLGKMEAEILQSLGVQGRNAPEIAQRLMETDAKYVRAAARMLRRLPGGETALSHLREGIIHSAASQAAKAAKTTQQRTGNFSISEFLDQYAGNSVRAVELGIMTRAERELGKIAVENARKILNTQSVEAGIIQTHNPLSMSNVLINVASRDPGFIARLLGMTLEKGKGADWLFHSPEGVRHLVNLRRVVVGGEFSPRLLAAANAATLALLDIAGATAQYEGIQEDE